VPEAAVGAVILTNADDGEYLLRPFMRRVLEILYDGKLEAAGDVAAAAARNQEEIAAARVGLDFAGLRGRISHAPACGHDAFALYVADGLAVEVDVTDCPVRVQCD